MSALTIGSMCSGYGGLDLAVEAVFGPARHAWHCEVDPDASTVLDAHWPDTPNLGDLSTVDWAAVEPVDVLTAGFPCQPVSTAGRRAGLADERWLFDDIADAIGRMVTPPRLCVFENVPGLLTANGGHAMARVVSRLAALGYVGRYRVLRASDVGAAHRRERVFILAWPAHTPGPGLETRREGRPRGSAAADPHRDALRKQPVPEPRRSSQAITGLPGATAGCMTLLPTPRASDGTKGGPNQRGSSGDVMLPAAVQPARWGAYAQAVAQWETVTGSPAPSPTEPNAKGNPRLAPRFVEWLMGLTAGWVTDHVGRSAALKALGNGVVPQQGASAIHALARVTA